MEDEAPPVTMTKDELLTFYRRVMNSIHQLGNIYYDAGRLEAYSIIAIRASDLRAGKILM